MMRRSVFIPAALALAAAAALLGGCKATDTAGNTSASQAARKSKAPTGTTEVHADGVRRVTAEELQKMLADGNTVVYDTRAKMSYDAEHIKGALSMPYDEVSNRAGELPKDKTLVFYCTWPNEHTSAGAALTLKQKSIQDTAALLGGMTAWKNAGLATEGSAVSK